MQRFEIICLANSIKYGGRCIAGLKTDGSGWLRPISRRESGTLRREHYRMAGNRDPKLFDILEIECVKHRPSCHQPENWIISRRKWIFRGLPSRQLLTQILKPEIEATSRFSNLLGNHDDRIDYAQIKAAPVGRSLALIKPDVLGWQIQESADRPRKYRVSFLLNGKPYSLSITDPAWHALLTELPPGDYSSEALIEQLNLEHYSLDGFRFSVSLGEPFRPNSDQDQAYCFKLVAAVINTTQILHYLSTVDNSTPLR